jgi:hypothetical protein
MLVRTAFREPLLAVCLALLLPACTTDDRDGDPSGGLGPGADDGADEGGGDDGVPDDDGDGDDGDPGDDGGDDGDTGTGDPGDDGGDDGDTGGDPADPPACDEWVDPFPPMPDQTDPQFPVGKSWQVGPNDVEYQINVPEGDTADLPLVLTADINNGGLRFENVVSIYIPAEAGGHNSWIDDEFWDCWPGCSVFTFLGVDGTRELLLELGTKVRFAHNRVFMDGVGEGREEITIGLDPSLQDFFAGVIHYMSEWQMAECPQVAGFSPQPCAPQVFFGISGCDHSFCPSQSCHDTALAAGFQVERLAGAEPEACYCPLQDLNARPHFLPMPDWIRDAHVDFVKTTTK